MMENNYTSYNPNDLTVSERHHLLLSAVAPRPIAFASTISKAGVVNLSPFSFFNVFSTNPPVMIFSPARSGRDNSLKHTHQNIKEVGEVVINVVNHAMVEQMSLSSSPYPKGVNEFLKSGFTELASDTIRPPRIKESPVAFECKVKQIIELGQEGGAGNLVVCSVERIHVQSEYLDASKRLHSPNLDLVGRMGGAWYCRASGASLFEVNKPSSIPGIGVDALPSSIRNSPILSGNQLGKLGSLTRGSTKDEIDAASPIFSRNERPSIDEVHRRASDLINEDRVQEALSLLLSQEETE